MGITVNHKSTDELKERGGEGYITFKDDHYEIVLDFNHPHKVDIMLHELSHFYRGDLLTIFNKKYNPQIYNIASDIIINESLGEDSYCFQTGCNFDVFEDAPITNNTKVLYDWLLDNASQDLINALGKNDLMDSGINNDNFKEAVKKWLEGKSEMPQELKEAIQGQNNDKSIGANVNSCIARVKAKPEIKEYIREFYNLLDKYLKMGTKFSKRTYRKVKVYNDYVSARRKQITDPKLLLFIDVSGSIGNQVYDLLSFGFYLKQKYKVKLFTFSDEVKEVHSINEEVNVWGGTLFKPIERTIQLYPGFIPVIISDFEFADVREVPNDIVKIKVRG